MPGNRLEQAAAMCWCALEHAEEAHTRAQILALLGWIERARADWERSTEAWEMCAATATGTRPAADALWLPAENLEWTGQPGEAADHLREFIQLYPDDAPSNNHPSLSPMKCISRSVSQRVFTPFLRAGTGFGWTKNHELGE